MESFLTLITALHLLSAPSVSAKPDFDVALVERHHVQTITEPNQTYQVKVEGLTDPENVSVEFIGPMTKGWVAIDGGWDASSLENLAASAIRPGMTDQEKAWAIWDLVGKLTFRMSLHASSDPLEMINVYGFGYCSTVNRVGPALWQAAGLEARGFALKGDYNCEVFYDGAWHLFNVYMRTYYPGPDGEVPASGAQLVADRWLVERKVTGGGGEAKEGVPGSVIADYFASGTPREGDFTNVSYSPRITLRQRERLVRTWRNWGAWSHSITEPSTYANGRAVFEPDFSTAEAGEVFLSTDNVTFHAQDGRRPRLHPLDSSKPASAVIQSSSPYPIVGGNLAAYLVRSHRDDITAVDFSLDGVHWTEAVRADGLGEQWVTVDLDRLIPRYHGDQRPLAQPYQFFLRLRFQAAGAGSEVGVNALRITGDVQYHPRVLPALKLGINTARFTAGNVAKGTQVIHRWRENQTLRCTPKHPYEGQEVMLEATIRNVGDAAPDDPWDREKKDVLVRFYAGETRPENQIGQDQHIGLLEPGAAETVRVPWTARALASLRHGGEANNWLTYIATPITVVVDPVDRPGAPASMAGFWESREDNNQCTIHVQVRQAPSILISEDYIVARPSDSPPTGLVTLAATVRNACIDGKWLYTSGTAAQHVRVQFFAGDPEQGGSQIGKDVTLDQIGVGRHAVARIDWDPRHAKLPQDIYVRVGPWYVDGQLVNETVMAHKTFAVPAEQ